MTPNDVEYHNGTVRNPRDIFITSKLVILENKIWSLIFSSGDFGIFDLGIKNGTNFKRNMLLGASINYVDHIS